ncbi:MAG: DUF2948 family protein [Alphaproteobacteria bacterium]
MTDAPPLKLLARDAEDLSVMSAALQDAVVAVKEMRYLPAERRFVLAVNRFRWEDATRARPTEGTPIYDRVHCGICFEGVDAVRRQGLDQQRAGQIISLLSMEAGDNQVELKFSAGITIRLEVDGLLCHLQDFDEPWPTQWRPVHPLDDERK